MTDTTQFVLSLSYRPAFGREDFLVAPCNTEAIQWLDKVSDWQSPGVLVYGEKGCGKTHLAHIFSETIFTAEALPDIPEHLTGKVVIEDIQNIPDESVLFHWYNTLVQRRIPFLWTAETIPHFTLPDLNSRLNALPKVPVLPPDDTLLFGLLYKAFSEKNIHIDPKVLEFAVTRMPRTFQAAKNLIEQADFLSLSCHRPITIPVIKEVLEKKE